MKSRLRSCCRGRFRGVLQCFRGTQASLRDGLSMWIGVFLRCPSFVPMLLLVM